MTFIPIEKLFIDDATSRMDLDKSKLCKYGIKPLDDACSCIFPDDLVVIGADPGSGKTTLGLHIAQHNAQRGKRVALYHLEGHQHEPVQRLKWNDICQIYYNEHKGKGLEMYYTKYLLNEIDSEFIASLEARIYNEWIDKYANKLFIYKKNKGLNLEQFKESLTAFSGLMSLDLLMGMKEISDQVKTELEIDLIVIDHLQYFSYRNPASELFEVSEILRACKEITENFNIPIILISHFRKKGKDRYMPGQEDFHGTSNIAKIASVAITLMPDRDSSNHATMEYPTYLRIAKSRIGIPPNIVMRGVFDGRLRRYQDEYQVYKLNSFDMIDKEAMAFNELPYWAKKGTAGHYTKYADKKYTDI